MLCGEFYFGPHVSWLFSEASTLIHLHTDAREDCPELDALLNILVRELAQRPRRQRYRAQPPAIRCWCSCCACCLASNSRPAGCCA